MTHLLKNKIKALSLLLVFSLNTVAGFACSVGVDMGYNKHHHDQEKAHSHQHGNGHHHPHNHNKATTFFKATNSSDDCCSNDVAKFTLLDKSVTDNSLHLQTPVFLLAFTATFLSQSENLPEGSVNSTYPFVRRSCFLNDTDLRIAIQSFQI